MGRVIVPLGSRYKLREAIPKDAVTVLRDIRKVDMEEWELSVTGGVAANLMDSIKASAECYTVASMEEGDAGVAHIILGVVALEPIPHTWLLGTNQGQYDCAWILQECRGFYREFFKRWPRTVCFSAESNVVHHRWLEWMGYVRTDETPWGPYGATFYRYLREDL